MDGYYVPDDFLVTCSNFFLRSTAFKSLSIPKTLLTSPSYYPVFTDLFLFFVLIHFTYTNTSELKIWKTIFFK